MRLVCPLMIFLALYTTLPHNLIKAKPLDLIERAFNSATKMKVDFILTVTIRMRFPLLQPREAINVGIVRNFI